jgi:hypothetical protein
MLVGPIPEPHPQGWDIAWRSMEDDWAWGFGRYHKNLRPWWLGTNLGNRLHAFDMSDRADSEIGDAYRAARAARFEHGENG